MFSHKCCTFSMQQFQQKFKQAHTKDFYLLSKTSVSNMLYQIHDATFKAYKPSLHLVLTAPITVSITQEFYGTTLIYHPFEVQGLWKSNYGCLLCSGRNNETFISKIICQKLTFKYQSHNLQLSCVSQKILFIYVKFWIPEIHKIL